MFSFYFTLLHNACYTWSEATNISVAFHAGGPYKAHVPLDSVQPVWPKVTVSNQIACAAHVHLHYSMSFFIVFR